MPSIFTSGIFTIVFEVRITNIPISFQSEIDEFGRQLTDMKFATLSLVWLTALSCVSSDLYLRRSEDSEVAICEQFDVCNLVHNPKWGINSVEKLCKCSEGSFCPTNFSPNDGSSLLVNARTQMKFCTPLSELQSELEMCDENEIAIQVKTVYQIDQVQNVSASILCNCNHHGPNYWKYNSRVGQFVAENEKLFEVLDNYQCSGKFKAADEFIINLGAFRTSQMQH